jgi:hypothetical protein
MFAELVMCLEEEEEEKLHPIEYLKMTLDTTK